FYAGVRRDLVPAEEHARKVEAATAARREPGFLVIARTEALIAGLGQEEALRRARAYADAGADAVLVHSKAHDCNELRALATPWSACRSSGRTSSAFSLRATRRPAPSSWPPASSRSSCPSSRIARRRCSR